ncbi:nucleoside 2-deoxyribosyltransferase domain-containing protein [Chryseobacterium caseinilyticum]|uniref:Nucleoside 2-deoxyribosyltransferase n=1 Tax=Chryseobacterium caseinilyticum TaxID=2771428 RepID=A0ABR8ZCI0_9FLAO|nr:nucleoside 2-deoxyribosyltransferase domain-containing protein [Chryseobacterium caseinilyticum]MBD8083019.1 hypothetical protein [Chryseobacterium caseinilyticum]
MKPKIYLAGGFKGGWHDDVVKKLGDSFQIFNPQQHNLDEAEKYTYWDLYHVKKCDILFCYMSKDNPSGYGLALEIGYARALNKLIVLVDDRSKDDEQFKRYFSICQASSNVILETLDEAIDYVRTFKI